MLRVTRLTDYATAILTQMARTPAHLLSAKSLSDKLKIGSATVSKILKILSARGLVSAVRGAEGGYHLAKQPEAISLVDILIAMEGPVAVTECSLAGNHCSQAQDCGVQGHWQRVSEVMSEALGRVTLADLIRPSQNIPFIFHPKDIFSRGE